MTDLTEQLLQSIQPQLDAVDLETAEKDLTHILFADLPDIPDFRKRLMILRYKGQITSEEYLLLALNGIKQIR